MRSKLNFTTVTAVLKSTRKALGISAAVCLFAAGCSDDPPSRKAPEPIPSIHPDGAPPPTTLPANVVAPGGPISTAAAEDTIAAALSEHETFTRVRMLADVLSKLGPEALDEVKFCLKQQVYHMGGAENVLMARFWALHEPAQATHWALYVAPRGFRLSVTLATAEVWAIVDPLEVALELHTLKQIPNFKTLAMELALVEGWFQSETPGLVEYIRGLGVGDGRQRLLRFLARTTIEHHGPEAAMAWAVALPEDDFKFKLNALRQLGRQLGKTHPVHAVAFCESQCEGEFGDGLRKNIAQSWSAYDGPATMEWIRQAPKDSQRLWAVQWAFTGWARADRKELLAWLDETGPDLIDPAFQGLLTMTAIMVGKQDPLRGFDWANAIIDPANRRSTTITVAKNWRKRDESAADAWLLVSRLSEVDRNKVRSAGSGKPGRSKADPEQS